MKRPSSVLMALAATLTALTVSTANAQGMRAEIGKPLQQAAEYIKAGKGKEALAKVREAEAVPNRSPAEQLMVDRMKASAAERAGEWATAIQALEATLNKAPPSESGPLLERLIDANVQAKNIAKASEWASRAQQLGYSSARLTQLQSYLREASGDYPAIAKSAAAAISAAEAAGRKPDENDLRRLEDALGRTGNPSGQLAAMEKLVSLYPKKEYWNALLSRLPRKPNFADRFGLDVLRLKLATGNLTKADEYMEMAQMAMQIGLPAEGLQIVDKGLAAKVLGTGPEADRHKRLRDLAVKKTEESKATIAAQATEAAAQKSGDDLVRVGYAYVTLGEADKGIAMIEQGIAKGGLKRAEDAKLRLGMAQLSRNKAKAQQTLRSVGGSDGSADIARLWVIAGG